MNKSELIQAVSKKANLKLTEAEKVVNGFIDTVSGELKKKNSVTLVGFGTFTTSKRKARMGRNPQTGEEIKIPARTVPVFRPGSELKSKVWR